MNRGDVYRIAKPPSGDPKKYRYFVVVSREALIKAKYSTVICAPIYTRHGELVTQVKVGIAEGLKHDSSIHCDAMTSVPRSKLTHYVGHLSSEKLEMLDKALAAALELYDEDFLSGI